VDSARSQDWLEQQFMDIWRTYFPDVDQVNEVCIRFVKESKTRLGWISLSLSGRSTLIGINRLLSNQDMPLHVCEITIAHEIAHYAHGFGSPLPRKYADPHANGIVEQELEARGLGPVLAIYQEWTETQWNSWVRRNAALRQGLTHAVELVATGGQRQHG